ncbi:hypothetical protein NQ315_005742 [Exocentrus adspersus]|uniref:Uncharacterized protein n=1 Tax=Exocentrus adspersus TaxID=1586481 RepID=A0AAV8VEF1_9CUCU|nr:hypothetical protein NQ315_005742 [Exocentrus adspersus]
MFRSFLNNPNKQLLSGNHTQQTCRLRVPDQQPRRNPPKSESPKTVGTHHRYPPTDPPSGAFRQSAGLATDPVAQTQAEAQVYPGHSKAKEPVADQPLPQADVAPASPGTNSEPVRKRVHVRRVHVGVNPVVLLGFTVAVLRRYLSP